MRETIIRSLEPSEVSTARELLHRNSDIHSRFLHERLPCYFDIASHFDPDEIFRRRQRLLLGAFDGDEMVGSVGVECASDHLPTELTNDEVDRLSNMFSDHQLSAFATLQNGVSKTYIGTPAGSLTVHSLTVESGYRHNGVARSLVQQAIASLDLSERRSLYIEVARLRWLKRFVESLGFLTVRKTFSLSERLQFGCWGALLLQYAPTATNNVP